MKKADSADSLVKSLETSSPPNEEDDKAKRTTLRRSFSENLPQFRSEDRDLTTVTKSRKGKTFRSRFTFGFRSLRGSRLLTRKSPSTSAIDWPENSSVQTKLIEDIGRDSVRKLQGFEKQPLSPRAEKKKYKITKRFSLNSITRQKVKSLDDSLVSSSTQTSTPTERRTPEGGNLSLSQISLVNIPSGGEAETENPTQFERVRQLQITISGRKTERSTVPRPGSISGDDYFSASSDPPSLEPVLLNRADSSPKLNITQSERDTPPRERAPSRPSLVQQNSSSTVASRNSSPTHPLTDSTGAVRKNHQPARLERQQSRDECLENDQPPLMRRELSHDRGRRFPRRTYIDDSPLPDSPQRQEKLERIQNYVDATIAGNNLNNPNLSGSIDDYQTEPTELANPSTINFSIGEAVRVSNTPYLKEAFGDSKEFSSIDSRNSAESHDSPQDTAKRRITFIGQPTLYTDEEKEILEGKREPLGNLSGISEYSFESDFSIDTQMPAFGDLTMDPVEAPIMTSGTEKREHLYKILVIGELGTGKTSFIKRYVHQFFSANYRATIGVDFALKVLHWDQNTIVRLQLWDIAGQERFGNMTRVYYKEAVGAFIVFDVTRNGTFDAVSKWKEDLDSKVQLPDGSPIPCILLANKCDQEKQGIITTPDRMDEYVKENGFAGWFETSAKENINIEESARALVNKILLNDKLITAADILDNDKFAIGGNGGQQQTSAVKKNCTC